MIDNFKKLMDCLNRQIGELENLCRLKDRRIAELERQLVERDVQKSEGISTWPFRGWSIPQICDHEYPFPWNATVPPNCKKCGMPSGIITIMSTNPQA